jgi:FkbM family methyltransferase
MSLKASGKRAISRGLCHPAVGRLVARAFRNRIPSKGCVIETRSAAISPAQKAMLFWRIYESAENRFIQRYLRRDLDVVELGASLGFTTCRIRKHVNEDRRLVCVEANPELAEQVRRNLQLNDLDKNVRILNRAISYDSPESGAVFFAAGDSNLDGRVTAEQFPGQCLSVEATTLSQVVAEAATGTYALVSDIEGAEAGLALREREVLKKCEQIIIELHDTTFGGAPVGVEQMCETFIREHGFSLLDRYGPVCVFGR